MTNNIIYIKPIGYVYMFTVQVKLGVPHVSLTSWQVYGGSELERNHRDEHTWRPHDRSTCTTHSIMYTVQDANYLCRRLVRVTLYNLLCKVSILSTCHIIMGKCHWCYICYTS